MGKLPSVWGRCPGAATIPHFHPVQGTSSPCVRRACLQFARGVGGCGRFSVCAYRGRKPVVWAYHGGGCRYDEKDGRVATTGGKQAKPEAWTPDQVYNECALRRKVFIGTVIDATGDGRYYHRRRYVLTAC